MIGAKGGLALVEGQRIVPLRGVAGRAKARPERAGRLTATAGPDEPPRAKRASHPHGDVTVM